MTDSTRRNFVQATLEDYLLETTSDLGDEGEEDLDSCSSFSLQQCIDEFRERRIRRSSLHASEQRDEPQQQLEANNGVKADADALADADLISQNRSNKEHERKCKPCKNGFCYCFTSDSGDGGCGVSVTTNAARAAANSFRTVRRSRKSECGQASAPVQQPVIAATQRLNERRSAPASLKTSIQTPAAPLKQVTPKKISSHQTAAVKRPLTAISRLETTMHDAPLIQIVQELRDNCVISEVRVNKHKLQARKGAPTRQEYLKRSITKPVEESKKYKTPTAPPMETKKSPKTVETLSGDSIPVARLEINAKSLSKQPGAGRLLQKRLSHSNVQYKPRDINEPPRKPPRASTGSQAIHSDCSVTSTSPSIRKAERIVNEFLIKKGVPVPNFQQESKISDKKFKKRLSFPLTDTEAQMHIPTCPSLSDTEQRVDGKNYPKEGCNQNLPKKQQDQTIRDISFGWKEPKVSQMLNYDTNGNRKEFKSQAAQAEPQTMGWQIPPKLSLDTVDGAVCHNLASNLATKTTPVKCQFNAKRSKQTSNYKFGWSWPTAPKCPRSFLKQSKKKILKLVTPKKDNRERTKFQARKTPYRNVAIQTSLQDFARAETECTQAQLSPPGSYHSAAVQTSNDITPQYSTTTNSQNNNTSDSLKFDFTRKVNSPPRKSAATTVRSTQRKLDFPSGVCGTSGGFCFTQASTADSAPSFGSARRQNAGGTYRSYQTELDHDVTLSKMNIILSNIRARLEASDEHAIRTFEEIERREQQQQYLAGFDCPDSHGIRRKTDLVDGHTNKTNFNRCAEQKHELIYSEIEEDSIHVSESPEFDNKTGIESSCSVAAVVTTAVDFEPIYAKVKKPKRKSTQQQQQNNNSNSYTPLGHFLHDTLRKTHANKSQDETPRLSIVMEPSISDDVSYSSPPLETASSQQTRYDSPTPTILSHCQSLNNIRVMEQHSPPKRNRNLSKSDLSLHRSEIFLENLCRSELIVDDGKVERLEKVDNQNSNRHNNTAPDSDVISYDIPLEMPNEAIVATNTLMQSPQKFLTKPKEDYVNVGQLSLRLPTVNCSTSRKHESQTTQSNSCPVTPQKTYNTKENFSITESNSQPYNLSESNNDLLNTTTRSSAEPGSTSTRYKRLKQALQKSFRKSKNFVKYRRASLPTPASTLATTKTVDIVERITAKPATPEPATQMATSCQNLDELFQLDETSPLNEQIARAVSICRQLPELETSHEMVEAERLLLYSTLQLEICKLKTNAAIKSKDNSLERHFNIQTMRLPIILEANLAGYFNYYFTITFECDGHIHSTQSTEYRRGEVVFHNCDFEFMLQKSLAPDAVEPCIKCNIFMLRLRKISTTPHEASENNDVLPPHDVTPLPSTPLSSASSSLDGIMSRFRLYASFSLNASSFKPFKLDNSSLKDDSNEKQEQKLISLKAFNHCQIPLKLSPTSLTSMENSMAASIVVIANAIAHFPQQSFCGFLHVQDPFTLHNWNWRWCTLIGLQLKIWADENSFSEAPLMTLDLSHQIQTLPLLACNRELCARARSFCVQCSTCKVDAEVANAAVFFAADSDADLAQWLKNLNEVFNFIVEWLQ